MATAASAAPTVVPDRKLVDLITAAESSGRPYYAIEFFPPRTPEGLANLYSRWARFREQGTVVGAVVACVRGLTAGVVAPNAPPTDRLPTRPAEPLYADVTWGAGGSTSDLTLDMCVKMKTEYGMVPNMHLTW